MTTAILFQIILESTNLKPSKLAQRLNIAPARITEWLNGQEIGFKRANEICNQLDLRLDCIIAKHAQSNSLDKSVNQPAEQ